jgi:hypothetical protein
MRIATRHFFKMVRETRTMAVRQPQPEQAVVRVSQSISVCRGSCPTNHLVGFFKAGFAQLLYLHSTHRWAAATPTFCLLAVL